MSDESPFPPAPDPPAAPPVAPSATSGPATGEEDSPPGPHRPRRKLALVLFLLTCASTFYVGGTLFGRDRPRAGGRPSLIERVRQPDFLRQGLRYAAAVMTILGAHEMGHYLQAVRYRVPASLPMFIPMPFGPLGTMGAVIVQQSGVADRRAMFDIAISGPLAGLVVALPLAWLGLGEVPPGADPGFGELLTMPWVIRLMSGGAVPALAPEQTNPLLLAGWVGVFITGLNLIPIGQLDGGHILYCLLGRPARRVARGLFYLAFATVVYNVVWQARDEFAAWTLMLVLLYKMGPDHPPTANDRAPLGWWRIALGWLTLGFIILGFVPIPITLR